MAFYTNVEKAGYILQGLLLLPAAAFTRHLRSSRAKKSIMSTKSLWNWRCQNKSLHKKSKMGQGKSNFTKQELEEYEELTYLSNSEVLQAFKKYRDIDPPKVKFYIFLKNSC